jgi:glycosyltransferase involved in cell wall biosynthesis
MSCPRVAEPLRILWVKIGGLWPLNMGGRLRSFHTITELARRHRVTVLTTHGPAEDPDGLAHQLEHCERVLSVPFAIPKAGTRRFATALARSWLSPYPADLWKCRVPALRARVHEALAAGVDVCVADFLVAMPNVPRTTRVPTVLFEHNVEYMIWKRLHEVERRAWRRALLAIEWRKMRRYEARACRQARLAIAVSEADRALLAAGAPDADIRAIPTGVDTSYFHPNGTVEKPATLVFTGSMDWYPNEDAILDFIATTLPEVRRQMPGVSLAVVGRNPSDRLKAAGAVAGVQVTGTVPDVRPHVAEAAVYIVPLRVGGGTRLKIFEALAMGKAVVSTTVGAEGLPIVPGEHFLQADGSAEFARAVVGLLKDSGRRHALGLAGRRLVEARYSWEQVGRQFERYCEQIVSSHAR